MFEDNFNHPSSRNFGTGRDDKASDERMVNIKMYFTHVSAKINIRKLNKQALFISSNSFYW